MTKKIKDSEILEILVDMDARVTPRWKVATKRRGASLEVGTNSAARHVAKSFLLISILF